MVHERSNVLSFNFHHHNRLNNTQTKYCMNTSEQFTLNSNKDNYSNKQKHTLQPQQHNSYDSAYQFNSQLTALLNKNQIIPSSSPTTTLSSLPSFTTSMSQRSTPSAISLMTSLTPNFKTTHVINNKKTNTIPSPTPSNSNFEKRMTLVNKINKKFENLNENCDKKYFTNNINSSNCNNNTSKFKIFKLKNSTNSKIISNSKNTHNINSSNNNINDESCIQGANTSALIGTCNSSAFSSHTLNNMNNTSFYYFPKNVTKLSTSTNIYERKSNSPTRVSRYKINDYEKYNKKFQNISIKYNYSRKKLFKNCARLIKICSIGNEIQANSKLSLTLTSMDQLKYIWIVDANYEQYSIDHNYKSKTTNLNISSNNSKPIIIKYRRASSLPQVCNIYRLLLTIISTKKNPCPNIAY